MELGAGLTAVGGSKSLGYIQTISVCLASGCGDLMGSCWGAAHP